MELKLIQFIRNNPGTWRQRLSEKPWCIRIKDDGPYTIFNYDQVESLFSEELVRECRGIIIKRPECECKVVCWPFYKFGNYGESYVPELDWDSVKIQEKTDGSLIKMWYDCNIWHVSTMGCIDAFQAPVGGSTDISFGSLFTSTIRKHYWQSWDLFCQNLYPDCTYMFELCTLDNRVVVPHEKPMIYHIATRNNITGQEEEIYDMELGLPTPKQFKFRCLTETFLAASKLPFTQEGFVLVDKYWSRMKVKGQAYLALAYMKNNGVMTTERIIDLIRANNHEEFAAGFPAYAQKIQDVQSALKALSEVLGARCWSLEVMDQAGAFPTQKEFALKVKDDKFSAFYFLWRKTKIMPQDWLKQLTSARLAEYIQPQLDQCLKS